MILKLLIVFAASALAVYGLMRLAPSMKLLAEPGQHRVHQSPTPMVGGIGIYFAIWLGFMLLDQTFARLMPSLLLLCVLGVLDDRYHLPSIARFVLQGAVAYLTIQQTGVELESLGRLTGGQEIKLGAWSTPVTIFAYIGVINAINLTDGLDGLAGSLVIVILASLFVMGSADQGLILTSIAAVLGFLVWNLRLGRAHARVFMGDAGSTMLGLLVAFLLIVHSQDYGGMKPVTALWLCALPLIDTVAVLLIRPLRGRSPFSADRIHYHHQLLDRGFAVNTTLCIALLLQTAFFVIALLARHFAVREVHQFYAFLGLFTLYLIFLWHRTARR